ncbi:potassium channel family protein [Dactylosporangium sp. CA-139066]|uniref:potassium channel family protein n=1 Tax=Dactylosporangium sp. CA-139066 TaxID=3239930 RepID=UPI003D8A96B0
MLLVPVLVDAGLLVLYLGAPLDNPLSPGGVFVLMAAALLVLVMVLWELRAMMAAPHPRRRALGILISSFPMVILPFAGAYVWLASRDPAHFGRPISHVAGLYFAMTVFTTTGFGDIAPRTEPAQLMVLAQMLADVLYVGLFARLLVAAARRAQAGE